MDLGLENRVVFVAGASSGLGRAAARVFLEEGARVALCSRSHERIQSAADEIAEATGVSDERLLPLDRRGAGRTRAPADDRPLRRAPRAAHQRGGPPAGRIANFDAAEWREALELNLMSTIHLCRHARPALERAAAEDDHARILMVTSVAAKQPVPTLALSNTARAGVQGFAKTLAEELGPTGATVNTLLPGYTRTQRLVELARSKTRLPRRSSRRGPSRTR